MRTRDIRNFLKFTYGDLLIIGILVIFIMVSLNEHRGNKHYIRIEINGKLMYKFPLSSDTIITAMGYKGPFKFQIKEGKIRMLNSTCPLHLCVKEGWISRSGDMIICIPNRVKISFGGHKYDAIIK